MKRIPEHIRSFLWMIWQGLLLFFHLVYLGGEFLVLAWFSLFVLIISILGVVVMFFATLCFFNILFGA